MAGPGIVVVSRGVKVTVTVTVDADWGVGVRTTTSVRLPEVVVYVEAVPGIVDVKAFVCVE